MKTFANANARSVQDATRRARDARQAGQHASFAGGGTDLLQLVKERIVAPDVIVNLKTIPNLGQVTRSPKGVTIGGLTTQVGSAARQADYSAQAQQVIHDQAQASRDAISGVNLDEEAADLMRLQQAYQAASQIIATADTLFQSLLAATRR